MAVPGGAVAEALERVQGLDEKTTIDATNLIGAGPPSGSSSNAEYVKSVTGGHGSWSMQLSHYEPAPPTLQQQLSTEFRKSRKHEEE